MLRKTTRWPQAALETCEKELRSLNASQRCLYSADALRHSVSSIKLKGAARTKKKPSFQTSLASYRALQDPRTLSNGGVPPKIF